jgi:hypothetical protein
MSSPASSFWTEGPERLREALEARRAEVDRLVARLRTATDPDERERVHEAMRALLESYAPSEDEISQSLFLLR